MDSRHSNTDLDIDYHGNSGSFEASKDSGPKHLDNSFTTANTATRDLLNVKTGTGHEWLKLGSWNASFQWNSNAPKKCTHRFIASYFHVSLLENVGNQHS